MRTDNTTGEPGSGAPADWPEAETNAVPYPEYGTDADALARMKLLLWIGDQLAAGTVKANPGDHILATDGRIVGIGPDSDAVFRAAVAAEPALLRARLVAYDIPPAGY